MGGRAKLRLGRSLPQTRARLRTARHYPQGISLRRLRMPHDRQYVQTTRMNFITGSICPAQCKKMQYGAYRSVDLPPDYFEAQLLGSSIDRWQDQNTYSNL